jgi:hypothetical protein
LASHSHTRKQARQRSDTRRSYAGEWRSAGGHRVDTAYCVRASVGRFGTSTRPEIAVLMHAMPRARGVVAARSWSTSQQPISEHWWADVLADPRARIRRQPRGFYGRDGRRMALKFYYRLADEPSPVIEVACSKCEWKAGFSRAEVVWCGIPAAGPARSSGDAGLLED